MPGDQPQPADASTGRLKSIVRFRPWIESSDGPKRDAPPSFLVDEAARTVDPPSASGGEKLTFDHVFGGGHDNAAVFAEAVGPTIRPFLEGRNSCVMAYGQTGSGKTHTVFGWDANDEGIVPRTVRAVFAACEATRRSTRYRLAVSFVEIYCEQVNDLLDPSRPSSDLSIRETAAGAAFVPNATVRLCNTPQAALELLRRGNENKRIGDSYVHSRSSRSHSIFTLSYAGESNVAGEAPRTVIARYSFVDLAGSEMLVDGFGEQQQKETKAINLSLLSLRGVIDALATKQKHLPYRNSALTRLLSQPLSAHGSALAICACSPAPAHAQLTAGTLRFGDVASRIKQQAALNVFVRNASGKLQMAVNAREPDVTKMDINAKTKPNDGQAPEDLLRAMVTTEHQVEVDGIGKVFTRLYHRPDVSPLDGATVRMCVFLHAFGNDCDGADFEFVYPHLVAAGYVVVAPDMPGFGQSPGQRQASRTDRLWDGPLVVVEAVLRYAADWARREHMIAGAAIRYRWLLMGHDWGGNMALSLAVSPKWRPKISGVVLHHPSWTEPLDVLANIKTIPVLLLWVPTDQLHLFSRGKRMAQHLKKSKMVSLVPEAGKAFTWAALEKALHRAIVPWLEGQKLLAQPTPAPSTENADAPEDAATAGAAAGNDEGDSELDELLEKFRQPSAAFVDPAPGVDSDGDADSDEDEATTTTNSIQSSFLANLLADPLSTDDLIAKRAALIEAERKRAVAALKSVRTQAIVGNLDVELKAAKTPEARAAVHLRYILRKEGLNGIDKSVLLDAMLRRGAGLARRPDVLAAVGHLPVLTPYALPRLFSEAGLWHIPPRGIEELRGLHRYTGLVGRNVFVPLSGTHTDFRNAHTFGFAKGDGSNVKVAVTGVATYRAQVVGPDEASASRIVVRVPCVGGLDGVHVSVPMSVLDAWNLATAFPTGAASTTRKDGAGATTVFFEDAIRADYGGLALRCKIAECAVALDDLASKLDFTSAVQERRGGTPGVANEGVLKIQLEAVRRIRALMDCTHHVQVGRDLTRLCVPDCGRLSWYGQWHCHGMASVFASLLLPFSLAFGWDVKYRDGFFYNPDGRDGASWDGTPRSLADHTWLEVAFFPSGVTMCVDPSFTDNGEPITVPLDEAYTTHGRRFPARDLTSRGPGPMMRLHPTRAAALHAEL